MRGERFCDFILGMTSPPTPEPETVESLRAALAGARAEVEQVKADAAQAKVRAVSAEMMVEHLQIQIAKLRREQYGQRSERSRHLLDQLEFQFEELEATLTEDEALAAVAAAAAKAKQTETVVKSFTRKRPVRGPFPAHLPRERQVLPGPSACPCCGGKLTKLGEDITETLESIPRRYKVIQTVREKFSCRSCETITQEPAPICWRWCFTANLATTSP